MRFIEGFPEFHSDFCDLNNAFLFQGVSILDVYEVLPSPRFLSGGFSFRQLRTFLAKIQSLLAVFFVHPIVS